MGLFSRKKEQPAGPATPGPAPTQQQHGSPGAPSPGTPPQPAGGYSTGGSAVPAPAPHPTPLHQGPGLVAPGAALAGSIPPAAISPAPGPGMPGPANPSSAEYQQELFRQHYDYLVRNGLVAQQQQLMQPGLTLEEQQQILLQQQQQLLYQQQQLQQQQAMLQQHAAVALTASGGGALDPAAAAHAAAMSAGGAPGQALLYQAAQQAAAAGRPLTLNFVAEMGQQPGQHGQAPLGANRVYGIKQPHEHPYGPPYDPNAPQPYVPPSWQPGSNPYDAIRIPALPDMKALPPELQDFRDQCATGVRQAVSMITSMEHQLWWERSRRQQAEEDCKVLLAAVHTERGIGDALLGEQERRRLAAAEAGGKLSLAADELPAASEAATVIQKHIRGRQARKEYETTLRDILRGVDPSLDPAGLPAGAQSHISNVNATGASRRLGLRAVLGGHDQLPEGVSEQQAEAAGHYRRQVDRISQRIAGHKDAGVPHPNDHSGDPLHADVKQLLGGSYVASGAQVIAALVRRCRELQAALLEAVGQLEESQLSIKGLKEANARLAELSSVRQDLETARGDNMRLAGTVAKLRTVLTAQAASSNAGAARENPFVAAWYRKAYADTEWQKVPPGGPGGVALMDGPDAAVETWDDLRASLPEPVLMPRVAGPGQRYKDLLGLKQDMIMAAQHGPPDPLYSMAVPDRSGFVYERDTPLIPTQTAAPLIRESLPPDTYMGVHEDLYRRAANAPGYGQPQQQQYPGQYPGQQQQGPMLGAGLRDAAGNLLPSSANNLHNYQNPNYHNGQSAGGAYDRLVAQQDAMRREAAAQADVAAAMAAGGGSGGRDRSFSYNRDTPVVPVYSVLPLIREDEFVRRSSSPGRGAQPPPTPPPQSYTPAPPHFSTNLAYVREQGYPPPPPAAVTAAAAALATQHLQPQPQQLQHLPPPTPRAMYT
ncbi:hypothetical protein CHLRE_06g303800v5 [Chlamydomonas reinhardtii]|uniref:Uncharacterized protein n=1 Tax=Chlamydomonas reinhardtii TaxID=3055 RepID=A0A2K3DR57_CHLRE|nr:uncharacterized protein CHLRE_06g303800v5 [Chlamydomonas reinhardtii]PNW83031.1 hypothetical protein CHLRE_06g303800v5 [Chlamydomonas reinhardtii]